MAVISSKYKFIHNLAPRRLLGLFALVLIGHLLIAQDQKDFSDNGTDRQEIIEVLEFLQAQNTEEDLDLNLLTENLVDLLARPIFLNQATIEELEQLPFLNPVIAQNIVKYISDFGAIGSYSELLRVDGISLPLAKLMQAFTTLDSKSLVDNSAFKDNQGQGRTEINFLSRQEFPMRAGLADGRFPGAPRRYYSRIKYSMSDLLNVGYIGEQDPGEAFKNSPDYNSLYAQLFLKKGRVKQILIGDYHINFGQNVLIGPTFALGKSPYLASWYRSGPTIKANTSAAESGFRRGIAAEIEFRKYTSHVFVSHAPLSASLDSVSQSIRSVNISGLHRTESELSRRKNAHQQMAGFTLERVFDDLTVGVGAIAARQTTDAFRDNPSDVSPYASLNFKYRVNGGLIYGEFARDFDNESHGLLVGSIISLAPELNFATTYRNYAPNYLNPFTNALSSSSFSINERGVLSGVEFNPSNQVVISAYIDYYEELENRNNLNSRNTYSTDALLQVRWFKKRTWELYMRARRRIDPNRGNLNEGEKVQSIDYRSRESLRVNSTFNPSSEWRLSQRLEYSFNQGTGNGLLLYADVQWRPKESPWSLDARYAVFDTDGFDGRIYAYEASLPYSFSIPAYFNRGTRKYIKLRYSGFRNTSIWLLYGVWDYEDVQQISSGAGQINSDKRKEVGLSIRYRL